MTTVASNKRQRSAPPPPQRHPLVEKTVNGEVNGDENMNGEEDDGKIELTVILPNGETKTMTVEKHIPVMDFQLKVAVTNKLSPSDYTIQVFNPDNGKPFVYQPSQAIGTLGITTVHIVSKKEERENRRNSVKHKSFEKTQRLTVNMPGKQKAVFRVNPQSSIADIFKQICSEKHLDMTIYELRLPANPNQPINLGIKLHELSVHEINLVTVKAPQHYRSAGDLSDTKMSLHQPTSVDDLGLRDQKKKRGFFSFLKKDKKMKSMDYESASLPRQHSREITPDNNHEVHSQTLPRPVKQPLEIVQEHTPVRPQRKKRAPAPPPQKVTTSPQEKVPSPPEPTQSMNYTNGTVLNNKSDSNNVSDIIQHSTVDHSRNSSDSSGYHEASTMSPSESPESDHSLYNKSSIDNTSLESSEIQTVDSPRASMETLMNLHQPSPMGSTETLTNMKNSTEQCVPPPRAAGKRRKAPAPPCPPKSGAIQDEPSASPESGRSECAQDSALNDSVFSNESVASSTTTVRDSPDIAADSVETKPELHSVPNISSSSSSSVASRGHTPTSSSSSQETVRDASCENAPSDPLIMADVAVDVKSTAPGEPSTPESVVSSVTQPYTSTPKTDGDDMHHNQHHRTPFPTFTPPPPPDTTPPPTPEGGEFIMQDSDSVEVEYPPSMHANKIPGTSPVIVHSRSGSSNASIGNTSVTTIDDIHQCFELTISAGEEAIRRDEETGYKTEMAQFVHEMSRMTADIHEGGPSDDDEDDTQYTSPRESEVSDTGSVVRHGSDVTSETSSVTKFDIEDGNGHALPDSMDTVKLTNAQKTSSDTLNTDPEMDALDALDGALDDESKDDSTDKMEDENKKEIKLDLASIAVEQQGNNGSKIEDEKSDEIILQKKEVVIPKEPPKKEEPTEFVFTAEDLKSVYSPRTSHIEPEQEEKPKRNDAYKEIYKELHLRRRSSEVKEPHVMRPTSQPVVLKAVPEGSVRGIQGGVKNRRSQFDVPISEFEQEHVLEEKSISQIALPATRVSILKTSKDPKGSGGVDIEEPSKLETTDKPNPFVDMSFEKPRSESDPVAYTSLRQAMKDRQDSTSSKPVVILESNNNKEAPGKPDVSSSAKQEQANVLQAQYEQLQTQFVLWQTQLQQNQSILAQQHVIPADQAQQMSMIQQQMAIQQQMMMQLQQSMQAISPTPNPTTLTLIAESKPEEVIIQTKTEVVNVPPPPPIVEKAKASPPPKAPKPPTPTSIGTPWAPKSFQKVELKPASKQKPLKRFEPKLDPREELMLAIKNHSGRNNMNKVQKAKKSFTKSIF